MRGSRRVAPYSEQALDTVVSSVYDAALGSASWAEVLPQVIHFLGAVRGGVGVRTRGCEGSVSLGHNVDPELLERWAQEFAGYDPWIERYAERRQLGELLHAGSESYLEEVRVTEVYERILAPVGADDMIVTPVSRHSGFLGYLGVYRSRKEGLFDTRELEAARRLAPHLVRAAAIQERIGGLGEEAAAAEAVLQLVPYGVLLLDADRKLLWANRQGERLLRQGSVVSLRFGAVRGVEQEAEARLATACAAAALIGRGDVLPVGGSFSVLQSDDGARLEFLAVPVGPRTRETTFAFSARGPRVALLIASPLAAPNISSEAVGEILQLPPALARLATAISAGKTVTEYAAEAGIQTSTARQQLKELLSRAGLHRQADLVRVLQRSVAALG